MTTSPYSQKADTGPFSWAELSVRSRTILERAGIGDVAMLSDRTQLQLWSIKGFGGKAFLECLNLLQNNDLVLKTLEPEYDFRPAAEALRRHVNDRKPFQHVGERLGLTGQIAYDLHVLLERAVVAGEQAKSDHRTWCELRERWEGARPHRV